MNPEIIEKISYLLSSVFTFNNLVFLLGLIGSAGTAWNVIQSRKNIEMEVLKFGHAEDNILIYAAFHNKSRISISIKNISIKFNGICYPCEKLPTRVDSRTYRIANQITGQSNYFNLNMPINLTGLSGTSGYILFELPKETDIPDSTHLTFLISPNRGSAIEKQCPIPQEC